MSKPVMQVDYAVIGGGIAGASVAYYLAPHGSVAVLEADARLSYHATGRSAAVFIETYGNAVIRALTTASKAFFTQPPPGFTDHALLHPRGALYIARPDQQQSLEDLWKNVSHAPGVKRCEAGFAIAAVPALREGISACIWDPDAADVEVHALHSGFIRGARAHGAAVLTEFPVEQVGVTDGVWEVRSGERVVRARVVVNAAGAWADPVASLCGAASLGLVPMRRTMVLVALAEHIDVRQWPMVIDVAEHFYFKPEAGKLVLSPADETPMSACDAYPDDLEVAVAIDRVESAADIHIRRIEHRWAGLRTFASDRSPVVGYDSTVSGVFWLAGQGGYGIQTAPALGELAASLVRGAAVPQRIADHGVTPELLSPGRLRMTQQ